MERATYGSVTQQIRDGVAILSLNRPEQGNAMVPDMMTQLAARLQAAAAAPELRAVVLTGAGSRFCVGADLRWVGGEADPAAAIATLVAAHHQAVRAMIELPVPLLAAVNGAAAGGGLSLALAADYRLCSPAATFTAAYFRLGLTPDGGNSALLVRALGVARTMELLLTNRRLPANEALAWGLASEVAPAEDLLDRGCALANDFGRIPPETLLATRRLLAGSQPLTDVLDHEESAMRAAAQRQEFRRSLQAFLDRRR